VDATSNTRLTRLAELGSSDRAALDALLDASKVAHVAVVKNDHPVVIPTACARHGDVLLMHGSTGSGWMREVATGAPVSVAVTSVEGLVVARSAFESSMLYRSAVLFGCCTVLAGDDKRAALDVLTDHLIPGRAAEVRASTQKELAATLVLALPIETWSLKISDDWPEDPPEDVDGPAWAGLLPLDTSYAVPVAAPDLRDGIDVPPSVRQLSGQQQTPKPPT
jgi:nitroimidazol reductase NimA-like FMN-containing flavoprotein (pyridoxamine 5'-phosphate oxidase superfamily)